MASDAEADRLDALEAELRELLAIEDPVPAEVTAFAKAAIDWRRVDSELAALVADSVMDEGLALARGSDTGPRALSYESEALTIDLEIHEGKDQKLALGQVAPPGHFVIEAEILGQPGASATESDELGRFRLTVPDTWSMRLKLTPKGPGHDTMVQIETSWIPL